MAFGSQSPLEAAALLARSIEDGPACQAISNLIADWNADPQSEDPAEDFYIPTEDQPDGNTRKPAGR